MLRARLGLARLASRDRKNERLSAALADLERELEQSPPLEVEAIRAEIAALGAAAKSDGATAARSYEIAIHALESRGLILRAIETAWEAAEVLRALGEPSSSSEFLRRAWGIVAPTGVEAWRSKIALELVAGGGLSPLPSGASPVVEAAPHLLARVAELMNSVLDYPALIQKSLEIIAVHLGAERGYILLMTPASGEIRTVGDYGSVDESSQESALSFSRTIVGHVASSGEAFQTTDAAMDPRLGSTQSVLDLSIRSVLCTPLRLKDAFIGTVYLERPAHAEPFGDEDLALVQAFSNLVAIAIENSRQHEDLKRNHARALTRNLTLNNELGQRYQASNIVGRSTEILRVLEEIDKVAGAKGTVLITGESGTGKDLVAKTIHFNSLRSEHPFLSLNCAAIPTDLIEAELFGIESHAATGVQGRPGIFERADKGTLFLDEIGDMPLMLQAKLLRVLQEREFMRVGTTGRVIRVDVRVIAATNQDLVTLIRTGRFREDLFYRLNALPIQLLPLRDRRADILPLAEYFRDRFCEENGKPRSTITPEFRAAILRYPWPGNVRELQNYVERAIVMSSGLALAPIPFDSVQGIAAPAITNPVTGETTPAVLESGQSLKAAMELFETRVIERALHEAQGNQRSAARMLGIPEPTLRYKMSRLEIAAPDPVRTQP
jgi:Nif-specific regulatory protein